MDILESSPQRSTWPMPLSFFFFFLFMFCLTLFFKINFMWIFPLLKLKSQRRVMLFLPASVPPVFEKNECTPSCVRQLTVTTWTDSESHTWCFSTVYAPGIHFQAPSLPLSNSWPLVRCCRVGVITVFLQEAR